MADLPLEPDFKYQLQTKPAVFRAKFGDGYEQRVQDGINNLQSGTQLVWSNISEADAQTLQDFFDDTGGIDAFTWQPDLASAPLKYVASEWGFSPITAGYFSFSASIYRVYE